MKKYLLIATLSIFILGNSFAQIKPDTIISNGILTSHFSYTYHNPLFVSYKIHKAGGSCNRSAYSFHTGNVNNSATKKDYVASGYDIGHLCPAEDFAFDCKGDSLTFFFYNAVPQTPNLNRGIWKHYETQIRNMSQNDSLLVIAGGIYNDQRIENTEVYVPVNCWKVVQSLSTKQVLLILFFTNQKEENSVKTDMSLETLQNIIKYHLPLKQ